MSKITVIGGGTGTSVVLSSLKQLSGLDLSAVVAVSDSGGSTGRLRDEFGFLAVGDIRQCLAALTKGELEAEMRSLLLYRFTQGQGLKGHNLGNLILTALEDMTHSPGKAISTAAEIFRVRGSVYPITEASIDLKIIYKDGQTKIGEHLLDERHLGAKKIDKIELSAPCQIYPQAAAAIKQADLVVLGPGDLYASLLPNSLATGFESALANNQGLFVYMVNLMTHFSQTNQMTASDHVQEVSCYCGRQPDVVVINNGLIPDEILQAYHKNHEYPVKDDLPDDQADFQVIRADLVDTVQVKTQAADEVPRSLLRHDANKTAQVIKQILNNHNYAGA